MKLLFPDIGNRRPRNTRGARGGGRNRPKRMRGLEIHTSPGPSPESKGKEGVQVGKGKVGRVSPKGVKCRRSGV